MSKRAGSARPAAGLRTHPVNGSSSVAPTTMIDLRNVSKAYQTPAGPFWALKGIDLQVAPGEFISVVGKSGSGKSTLINMFTGIDHPSGGEAIVAQTRIGELNEEQMAMWRGRNLGIIFQFFQLLPALTIVENVMLPMDLSGVYAEAERAERAMHLLELVEMADDAHKFPSAVSGGQQQKAAIARALANDPPVLVADEPTGNLDSRAADGVFGLFESLVAQGKTILMVTHDDEMAARVPRTVTLADGLIVDEVRRGNGAGRMATSVRRTGP
ncbi:MAG: ABC transporter ATP-binding protein [Anaerolineae bacterium]|nr:ABC transporter ATP-binding protein [Anaerolineae bacterium]